MSTISENQILLERANCIIGARYAVISMVFNAVNRNQHIGSLDVVDHLVSEGFDQDTVLAVAADLLITPAFIQSLPADEAEFIRLRADHYNLKREARETVLKMELAVA